MKRIPWQFYQNSSLQLFGESAIRPLIFYTQIKGTRQTSIVIPKNPCQTDTTLQKALTKRLYQNESRRKSFLGQLLLLSRFIFLVLWSAGICSTRTYSDTLKPNVWRLENEKMDSMEFPCGRFNELRRNKRLLHPHSSDLFF